MAGFSVVSRGGRIVAIPQESTMVEKCLSKTCTKMCVPSHLRGLCMSCYITAKKMVEANKTTWNALEGLGLVLPLVDPFTKAFNKTAKGE